ncbi:MAG TPA: ABC transporter ATP-binding protein [Amnibacterium sp.]|jgi:putative ABC transport system ATP-binding protein|nr:ABC transporter ATP-binding protein [Amnibacterium sp.]
MSAAALEVVELYRFFRTGDEEIRALRGVSVRVEPGEFVAVAGPSGSGKSTLLACIAGLDEPAGGSVHIGGERMSNRPEPERARIRGRSLGVLLQSGNLLGHLDVTENVRLAQHLAGGRRRAHAEELLGRLGLAGRRHALPDQLSGGETARAGLAVALAADPVAVVADEPTGELDSAAEAQVLALLRERTDEGGAVLVVTHSATVMAEADRTVRLLDGKVTE